MRPQGKVGRGDGEFPSCGEGDRTFRRSQRDGGGSLSCGRRNYGGAHRPRPPLHPQAGRRARPDEHTSELQSLTRISYAVFCLKNQITTIPHPFLLLAYSSTTLSPITHSIPII